MILSIDYSYLRLAASPSDYMKEQHSDKRSWWVNPEGKIYDVGHDHNKFLEKHKKTFGGYYDINQALTMNWIRVGIWNGEFFVHCHSIRSAQVAACQQIYKGLGGVNKIYISTLNKSGYISEHDFIWAESASGWIRNLFSDPTGIRRFASQRSSLPKSRNFLMGVSLEDMPWPLRQAFDLLNLSGKKDKLSANQVASVFQSHDKFLQDHINRTSTELIQELNSYFQYGPEKEQIA